MESELLRHIYKIHKNTYPLGYYGIENRGHL